MLIIKAFPILVQNLILPLIILSMVTTIEQFLCARQYIKDLTVSKPRIPWHLLTAEFFPSDYLINIYK